LVKICYNQVMKLYQTIDGELIGFYKERGGEVQALLYRDVYESQLVDKTREDEVTIPGYWEIVVSTVPGYWKEEREYVQGHYERQMVWHPEYSVTRYRDVPAHYEIQNIWVPDYYVTRYYWREAHPARGLEAAWIPYQELIPAGYEDQRVWVETFTEPYQELMPAVERETRVWVEGKYVTEKAWVPESEISTRVWMPPEITYETVKFQEFEVVWVRYEPVYEFVDESMVRLYEVVELTKGAGPGPEFEDVLTIRNMLTGELLDTYATYIGLAERIADNEFVVPSK